MESTRIRSTRGKVFDKGLRCTTCTHSCTACRRETPPRGSSQGGQRGPAPTQERGCVRGELTAGRQSQRGGGGGAEVDGDAIY